jgi:DNA (cytosine-5)-methyltransferase 1
MDIDDWDDDHANDRRSYARVIKNIVKSKTAPAQAVKAKRVPAKMMTKRVQGTEKRAAGLAKHAKASCKTGGAAPEHAEKTVRKADTVEPLKTCATRTIRVASDCSGLNSAQVAIEFAGIDSEEVFASDKDGTAKAMLSCNFPKLKMLFGDVGARDNAKVPGNIDFYNSGPPCQTFSCAGAGHGVTDPRGAVFFKVLDYIRQKRPRTFALENVEGLRNRHPVVFEEILQLLHGIKDDKGKPAYEIRYKILDSHLNGLPQSRKRLYIVGWQRSEQKHEFEWPEDLPSKGLKVFLERTGTKGSHDPAHLKKLMSSRVVMQNYTTAMSNIKAEGGNVSTDPYVVDLHSSANHGGGRYMRDCSPCLTRSRCGSGGYFLVHKGRMMETTEMLKLQGFPLRRLRRPTCVSERQFRMMIGNSFSVPVIGRVAIRLLFTVGLVKGDAKGNPPEPWA